MKENLTILKAPSISTDDELVSECSSMDAFAHVVHDITGGNVPVDLALPLKIENAYSNTALILNFMGRFCMQCHVFVV